MADRVYGRPFTGKDDPRNNLKGRPKLGQSMADLARAFLKEETSTTVTDSRKKTRQVKMLRSRLFLEAVFARAIRESDAAARLFWNYVDGLPPFRGVITTEPPEGEPDYSKLTDEELATMVVIMQKARNGHVVAGHNGNGNGKGPSTT